MCPECSRFNPNRFTFDEVIAERVNTAETRRKVNCSIRLKPIFEPNNDVLDEAVSSVVELQRGG